MGNKLVINVLKLSQEVSKLDSYRASEDSDPEDTTENYHKIY